MRFVKFTLRKKGFSGGKAVAGAILTGGIGLLAGTIGSNDIKITCLKCGNKFKAGEARVKNPIVINGGRPIDNELKEMCENGEILQAIKRYKDYSGENLSDAKQYVDNLRGINTSNNDSGGCYIATAVYGSYSSPEVLVLRQYRDNILSKNIFGRLFIKVYYKLSPPIAKRLKYANIINSFVRYILDKWVVYLYSKNNNAN